MADDSKARHHPTDADDLPDALATLGIPLEWDRLPGGLGEDTKQADLLIRKVEEVIAEFPGVRISQPGDPSVKVLGTSALAHQQIARTQRARQARLN